MRHHKASIYLALLGVLLTPPGFAAPLKADLLVINAHIKTMDPKCPEAEAMAISGGKVIATGNNSKIKAIAATKIYDAGQALILPGFHDSHVHLAEGSIERLQLNFKNCKNKREILLNLASYASAHPGTGVIVGNGVALPALMTGGLSHQDLDRFVPNRPVILHSEDWHTLWLNAKAISLIKQSTLDKLASQASSKDMLERHTDGTLSGVFKEQALVVADDVYSGPSLAQRVSALKETVKIANSFGITSIQDAHATEDVVETYQRLARANSLNLRVTLALHTDNSDAQSQVEQLKIWRDKINRANNPWVLKATSAKIFVDGVIETGTAALLSPYLKPLNKDRADGQPNLSAVALNDLVAHLVAADFNVHMHAIGDRGVRMALDSLAAVKGQSKAKNLRHQIAHLEMIDPSDVARFKEQEVTANWQSYWAQRDPYIEQLTIPQLGPERSSRLYPMHDVAASGARMAAGSDWTVSTLNPLDAIQVAVTRTSFASGLESDKVTQEKSGSDQPLAPEQGVSLEQILEAYTTGGAWVNCSNSSTGSLTPGKLADFVVFDRDFTRGKAQDIHKAQVVRTYLAGKTVYIR